MPSYRTIPIHLDTAYLAPSIPPRPPCPMHSPRLVLTRLPKSVHSTNRPTSCRPDHNHPHLPFVYHTFYHGLLIGTIVVSKLPCKPFTDYATSLIRKHEQLLICFRLYLCHLLHTTVDTVYDLLHTIIRHATALLRSPIIGQIVGGLSNSIIMMMLLQER
jgi:hypothetical protein